MLFVTRICTLILVASALCSGCGRKSAPAYGREFNNRRRELGIPIIPDQWIFYRPPDRQIDWVDPLFNKGGPAGNPLRATKTVMLTVSGELDYEYDIFYSGKKYPSAIAGESDDTESMQLKFSYQKLKAGENPWDCHVPTGPDQGSHTLADADAILRKWGLSRTK